MSKDADTTADGRSRRPGRAGAARTLGGILRLAARHDAVRRGDLRFGDRVVVRTRNSVYSLLVAGNGLFLVSGGWFDVHASPPVAVSVNGCTYGGSAIRHDVVAAPGLFLEFGNRVSTTRIQKVSVLRHDPVAQ